MNCPKCGGKMYQFTHLITNAEGLKCEKCGYEWIKGMWR